MCTDLEVIRGRREDKMFLRKQDDLNQANLNDAIKNQGANDLNSRVWWDSK
jgi:hypothetical protein